jgi:hypothetical protein
MNKNYYVKLKNGDSMGINEEQFNKLSKVLIKTKAEMPNFIQINDNIVKVDFIATIKAEAW